MRDKLPIDNPGVAGEWDCELNAPLRPDEFTGGADYIAWWQCKTCGNRWQAKIYSRTEGRGCPICARDRLKQGVNDLATLVPAVAAEWDYYQNEPHLPSDFTYDSTWRVWWTCKRRHNWPARINKRTKRKQKCPYCCNNKVWPGYNDIPTTHPQLLDEWDSERNAPLRPEQFTAGADIVVAWKCGKCGHRWKARVYTRKKHGCPCCAGNILVRGVNDLKTVNPTVARQWDRVKNGKLSPGRVAANDNRKAWWICNLGHSWEAAIYSRNNGKGCPFCGNRAVLPGFNDLATRNPGLLAEWCYKRNKDLTPQHVSEYSRRKVWWRCVHGHDWKARVSNRSKGAGCPYCAGKIADVGVNDLKTLRPDLTEQWDTSKNNDLTPEMVTLGSHAKAWWICGHGHSYRSPVVARVHGTGCPYCAHKLPIVGETDFATVHPELMGEWDFVKNANKRPQNYTYSSNKKVWWICEKGHSWKTSICNRHRGSSCPYCYGSLAIPFETDAATITPHLVKEWAAERNNGIDIRNVLPFSNIKYWWRCDSCGHYWQSTVGARTQGSMCPRCFGKAVYRPRLV